MSKLDAHTCKKLSSLYCNCNCTNVQWNRCAQKGFCCSDKSVIFLHKKISLLWGNAMEIGICLLPATGSLLYEASNNSIPQWKKRKYWITIKVRTDKHCFNVLQCYPKYFEINSANELFFLRVRFNRIQFGCKERRLFGAQLFVLQFWSVVLSETSSPFRMNNECIVRRTKKSDFARVLFSTAQEQQESQPFCIIHLEKDENQSVIIANFKSDYTPIFPCE